MPSFFSKTGKAKTGVLAPESTGGNPLSPSSSAVPENNGTDAGPPSYIASENVRPVADGQVPDGVDDLPSKEEISNVNLTEAFDNLNLDPKPKHPDVDTCLAHLKLLFAIQTMKDEVGYTDGLWNIWDSRAGGGAAGVAEGVDPGPSQQDDRNHTLSILSKIREKRWAIFLARAVDRYEAWWSSLRAPDGGLVETDMCSPNYGHFAVSKEDMFGWMAENLPPLDVVMVWHAHMLNPRAFMEDTILAGLRQLWHTGMPWAAVNAAINNKFDYTVTDDLKARWVSITGRSWDNIDDPIVKSLQCPACKVPLQIPWTTCGLDETYKGDNKPGLIGNGYGDGNFLYKCPGCDVAIDKELLSVSKFVKDTEALLAKRRPMPGTVLDPITGIVEVIPEPKASSFPQTFPNRMIQQVLRIRIMELINPCPTPHPTMETVRGMIEGVLENRAAIRLIDHVTNAKTRYKLQQAARIAVRKMMARYWENFSPFALDLAGAVLRQGIFVEKMVKIDWLHSPSAADTMSRLLTKYTRFFAIMASNPLKTAVPTLDIDLAWHTHQLSPSDYYAYSIGETSKFIDHDDKIEESQLNTAFEWTSKTYQEKYGEVYSECTCWYCETIRSTHISTVGKLLGKSNQEKVADGFYTSGAASFCPPDKSAHISSHNAVRMGGPAAAFGRRRIRAQLAALNQQRLDDAYAKAQRRAEKKGRKIPPKQQYYDYWGYPWMYYNPYMYPQWFTPGMYYGWDPGHVAGCGSGGWAACAAGSCGGGVAAGACGGPGVSFRLHARESTMKDDLFGLTCPLYRAAVEVVVALMSAALEDAVGQQVAEVEEGVAEEEEEAAEEEVVSEDTLQGFERS